MGFLNGKQIQHSRIVLKIRDLRPWCTERCARAAGSRQGWSKTKTKNKTDGQLNTGMSCKNKSKQEAGWTEHREKHEVDNTV